MDVNHKPSLSNLGLQITLQYNILFSITYACIQTAVAIEKANYYDKLLPLSLVAIWAAMEPFRLYFGFQGNLRETVPDTATFLLMGLFPQCAVVAYQAFFQPILFPIDYILGVIMLFFLAVQLMLGIVSIRTLINAQTAQFMRLCEEEY